MTELTRPMRCDCPEDALAAPPANSLSSYRVDVIDGLREKAKIFPGTGVIQIDRAFRTSLSDDQWRAVMAHELAHDEDSASCESCTDARAGARLRHEGMSARQAVAALSSVVGSRRAGEPLLYGWNVADRAIRGAVGQRKAVELTTGEGNVAPPSLSKGYSLDGPGLDDNGSMGLEDGPRDVVTTRTPIEAPADIDPNGQSLGSVEAVNGTSLATPAAPTLHHDAPRAPPAHPAADAFPTGQVLLGAGLVLLVLVLASRS